ncbi:MAG: hypothetical protein RIF41_01525, partial [Polyangiaceae bacterium]
FGGYIEMDGGCDDCDGAVVGPVLQLGWINLEELRLAAWLQAGGEVAENTGIVGEVGIVGHILDPGVGLHTGLLVQFPYYLVGFARQEWFLDEYSFGTGLRVPPTFLDAGGDVSVGRPWRDTQGEMFATFTPSAASASDRDRVASAWAASTRSEAASVPAFWQLALELLAHDAPDALVEAALDAADDEIRHTVASAEIASRISGRTVPPSIPTGALRPPLRGPNGLARLALESWLDGCLAEGAAVRRAERGFATTHDTRAKQTLAMIVVDERRHEELAWEVLAWALSRGRSELRGLVRAYRDREPSGVLGSGSDLPRRLAETHGLVDASGCESTYAQHAECARRRLDALLAA